MPSLIVVVLIGLVQASEPVMWFQPGLWGQPAAPPGVAPIDPPDVSSGYLSTIDHFLRPKPDSLMEEPTDGAMLSWLGKWREWVKSAPGEDMPPPVDQPGVEERWWSDRMRAAKALYDRIAKGSRTDDDDDSARVKPGTTKIETTPPDNKEPSSPDDEILLPSKDILEGLRCRPIVSFQSCADHCVSVLPVSRTSPSLTAELVPKPRNPLTLFKRKLTEIKTDTNATGDRNPRLADPDAWNQDGWEAWQVSQFKSCVFSVCVNDYLKRPIPGCLGPDGRLVPLTDAPRKIRASPEPGEANDFDDYDFYDPKRLEFWRGVGFYNLVQAWHHLTGGPGGAARVVFLPIVVLLSFFALPAILIAIVFPICSRLMSSGATDYVPESCDVYEEVWLRMTEPVIGAFGEIGQKAAGWIEAIGQYLKSLIEVDNTAEQDGIELCLNMDAAPSPPVADAMKRKLLTHGESSSAATIDTCL